ncbi:RNA polymerase sigma-70 factor, ECF subfamily [Fontimonas thermophila]|uniref:RNA polymerase sigma-70 factor, ECF subfamily n=1 Tax=Fontimonas thermophila TaxID=1076937 RepID=A0A1I2IFZ5_9GAMM|nr:RNA polymerase sigma-70 factor, ECF subfamily [Fontimonas thermophila]
MHGFHRFSPVLDNERLASLLARVALRDQRAFRELYDQTAAHLLGVALRIVGTRSLAEEALQDAFVQFWNHASSFNPARARASTWMISIVRYRCLDLLRKSENDLPLDEVAESALPVVEPFSGAHREPRLDPCLDELTAQQRACISMAYVEGRSHQEISRHTGTPLGTVKSWIRRGLQQLRECLER